LAGAAVIIALGAMLTSFVAFSDPTPGEAADPVVSVLAPAATSLATAAPPQVVTTPSTLVESPQSTRSSNTVRPSGQTPVTDPIAATRLSIQQQVNTGNLNPDKASDLYTRVDAIAKTLSQGNTDETTKAIKAMRDKLVSLRNEGQLTASGYDTLTQNLNAIASALP
jgi:serine/threonine-protein kinase